MFVFMVECTVIINIAYMEILPQFDLDGQSLTDISRDDYYTKAKKEWAENGKILTAIGQIWVVIIDPKRGMLLQKKATNKKINPGLWDTTIGHIQASDTPESTCEKECYEELQMAVKIVEKAKVGEYMENPDIKNQAYLAKIETKMHIIPKNYVGIGQIDFPVMLTIFFGYYSGECTFGDGEVEEVKYFSREKLQDELNKKPGVFAPHATYLLEIWERCDPLLKQLDESEVTQELKDVVIETSKINRSDLINI